MLSRIYLYIRCISCNLEFSNQVEIYQILARLSDQKTKDYRKTLNSMVTCVGALLDLDHECTAKHFTILIQ